MTLHNAINMAYDATTNGYINGVKLTRAEFTSNMVHWFSHSDSFIFEVSCPDGRWLSQIAKFSNGEYGYDLPETREQENRLYKKLGVKC